MELVKEETLAKEEILEEKNVINEEKTKRRKKPPFKIYGFTITKLLTYFVIYSVVGYIIETVFGILTKGVWESRKSFLYGPFCAIYGVGAVVMIVGLQRFKKNNYTLFIGGFLIGSIVEYVISWAGEMLFHIKWWDYSSMPFNINGRICIWFSFFWGVLAIYLMSHFNPKVDKFLDKFSPKVLTGITIALVIFMYLDSCVTGFALRMLYTRLTNEYNIELQGVDSYLEAFTELYENPEIKKIVDKFFNDEVMIKTFPNIKVTGKDGNTIWVCDILKDIQPYYIRFFTPRVPRTENFSI